MTTTAEVRAAAERHGFTLDDEAAAAYRAAAVEQMAALRAFVGSRAVEEDPWPRLFPERSPGHRPSAAEDPYGAWVWRCSIGGADEGLLAGRTVSFKDHVAVAGIPLTYGSAALDRNVADIDATVVTRVLAAGGRVVGKNPLFGFTGGRGLAYGSYGDQGDPVNPRAPDRLTGGSSSGSAVAVAAGEVDVAFGGDQAGSVRIPSAWCGVVGLKPTFGLVSHAGITHGADPSVDHVGPIARRVADVAAALDAVAGHAGDDPRQDRTVPDRVDTSSGLDDGVAGLRVGVLAQGLAGADPEVRDAFDAAVAALGRAGAAVRTVSVPEHDHVLVAAGALLAEGYLIVRGSGAFGVGARTRYPRAQVVALDRLWSEHADQLKTYYKVHYVLGELSRRSFGGAVYAKAQNVRPGYVRAYDRALAAVDLLVMPTCLTAPPERPADVGAHEGWRRQLDVLRGDVDGMVRNTLPFDYTGHPALTVPCGGSGGGLPVGVQLVGRYFDEATVLRAGRVIETDMDQQEERS